MSARYWIRRSVFGWWVGINPDEALATMDTNTHWRAWTRERLIAKLTGETKPERRPWEEIPGREQEQR